MTVELTFFNAAGLLPAELEAEIRAGIGDGVAALRRHVEVDGVGIAVFLSERVDAETGLGGHAHGPDACEIRVDEASSALRTGARAMDVGARQEGAGRLPPRHAGPHAVDAALGRRSSARHRERSDATQPW